MNACSWAEMPRNGRFAGNLNHDPSGTELLGLSIKDGIATVDLSGEFESGGGSASQIGRLGQVVFTLTQFSSIDSVAFRVDGRPVTVFGSEGIVLEGPIGRADESDPNMSMFESVLPAIFVDGPAWGVPRLRGAHMGHGKHVRSRALALALRRDGRGSMSGKACDVAARAVEEPSRRPTFYPVSETTIGNSAGPRRGESGLTDGGTREYQCGFTLAPRAGRAQLRLLRSAARRTATERAAGGAEPGGLFAGTGPDGGDGPLVRAGWSSRSR